MALSFYRPFQISKNSPSVWKKPLIISFGSRRAKTGILGNWTKMARFGTNKLLARIRFDSIARRSNPESDAIASYICEKSRNEIQETVFSIFII